MENEFEGSSAESLLREILGELRLMNAYFSRQEKAGLKARQEAKVRMNESLKSIPSEMRGMLEPFMKL